MERPMMKTRMVFGVAAVVIAGTALADIVKPLAPAGSMNKAIALYNGTESNQTVTAELDAICYGWDEVTVWDCYEHKALPNARRKIVTEVPPHGTRIYRLAPVRAADEVTRD